MVIIVKPNNTIDIRDVEDFSYKGLAKMLDAQRIEPLRVYNLNNKLLTNCFFCVNPNCNNGYNEFATTLSSLKKYYGEVVITKQTPDLKLVEFTDDEEIADVILQLVSTFDFLKVGFLDDDLTGKKYDDMFENTSLVSFGRYPQSLVNDLELIEKLDKYTFDSDIKDNQYFKYDNKDYYVIKAIGTSKVTIKKQQVQITKGKNYYFNVEPITWSVLYEADDVLLLCNNVIDYYYYNKTKHNLVLDNNVIDENDFYFSDIRKFLNRYFYNRAFTETEKNKIISIIHGNDIDEKVSLVSSDIIEYIKSMDAVASDYAICMGAERLDKEDHTSWWLKSKGQNGDESSIISSLGNKVSYLLSYGKKSGIRPIIHVEKIK